MRAPRPALLLLGTLAAGCSSGFSVGITVEEQCPIAAARLVVVATSQPGNFQAMSEVAAPADFFSGAHRIVVVPPDGASQIDVEVTAFDAGGAKIAAGSTMITVDGHQLFEATLTLTGAACGDAGAPASDGQRCASNSCGGATPYCDAPSGQCVACLTDDHCSDGTICRAGHCVPGCSDTHGCGDGGSCEVDAGRCVACRGDIDCGVAAPRCDLTDGRCVVCLPQNDNCTAGRTCTQVNGVYQCALGCKDNAECKAADGGAPTSACCNHLCVDTGSDNANCSGCGVVCGGNKACCSASCIDVSSDASNCGGCGRACNLANATAACVKSACVITGCTAGFGDCNVAPTDGCEAQFSSDPLNCGGCGGFCSTNHVAAQCSAGKCSGPCAPGFTDCDNDKKGDGCEVATGSDVANCGGCGTACSNNHVTPTCTNGNCLGACVPGYGDCDNNLRSDGCETDTNGMTTSCGGCGRVCSSANVMPMCNFGICDGACANGFGDCNNDKLGDGCETPTDGDPQHCGGCGNICSTNNVAAQCTAGICSGPCAIGFADCNNNKLTDGCEAATNTVQHCGGCTACAPVMHGNAACIGGVCRIMFCVAPYADCDGLYNTGCETDTSSDKANCGTCKTSCGGNPCVNSMCVGPKKRVFVSSVTYNGAMGGLIGADGNCQALANAQALGGSWKAWLSDRNSSVAMRFAKSGGPYILVGGATIANNFVGLSGNLLHPIDQDEKGNPPPASNICNTTSVFTNTNSDGSIGAAIDDCTMWTVADNSPSDFGDYTLNGGTWSDWCAGAPCSGKAPIYCFEQ